MDTNTMRLYQRKAGVLRALAHPLRLAIVEVLRDGETCVCDITRAVVACRVDRDPVAPKRECISHL